MAVSFVMAIAGYSKMSMKLGDEKTDFEEQSIIKNISKIYLKILVIFHSSFIPVIFNQC